MTFSLFGSIVDLITTVLRTVGLPGLFALMVVESFGIPPLPSEVILPFAGFLVAMGDLSFGPTVAVALAGALVGAYVAYAVGRWWRHRIAGLGIGPVRLEERHLVRMDRWFQRHGEATVALARCVPVLRSYISYPAGTARMDAGRFGVYTLLGSIPFTLALVYAGFLLGNNWTVVENDFRFLDYALYAILAGLAVYLIVRIVTRPKGAGPVTAAAPTAAPGPPPDG